MKKNSIEYTATIVQHKDMDAAYVEFPFDIEGFFGRRGKLKVKAVFDGHVVYRGSLFNMGGQHPVLGLTKAIRQQLNKTFGDQVTVSIEEDKEVREVAVPYDVVDLLKKNQEAELFFEKLSFTDRKEYIFWITSAKKKETRDQRLALFIEKLTQRKKLHDK
ncbi:MAG TPA: YdeI/OmpD-associated family protein [Bacteroidales bacterium]|nr:YdeI/OmpD-associated family protein [Bacteroidales bacterium]